MNIVQKIIDIIRFSFIKEDYYRFCKLLKNKKLFILASCYSSISSMKQRPEHLMNFFLEDGYIVILPDKHFAKVLEIETNKFYCPYYFLPKLLRDKKLNKTFMSISTHYTLPHISRLYNKATKKGDIVIYEHLDDFELLPPAKGKILKNEFKKICQNTNIVISATADSLFNEAVQYRGSDKNIVLVKNAVNTSDFKLINPPQCPIEIKDVVALKKPIVGYYGCIIDEWFDYELLSKVARSRRDIEFILIGIKGGKNVEKMFKFENITYVPKINYEQIPLFASFFDIATIPFQLNNITKSTSPVKMFEYMALSLPIITTPLDECKKYKSCLIAHNAKEYSQLIDKALRLKNDKEYQNLLKLEAEQNTWSSRYKILKNLLNNLNR